MNKLLFLFFIIVFSVFGGKKDRLAIQNAKRTADSAMVMVEEFGSLLRQVQATQREIIRKQNVIDVLVRDFSATRVDNAEVQLLYLTEAFRDLYSQVNDIRLIPFVQQAQRTAARPSGFTVSAATQTLGGDEYALYSRGLDAFRKNFFEESRQFMREVLNSFPGGVYSDRATHWIAESHFSEKNYSAALGYYEKVLSFQGSSRKDDAQYRIGICYMLMGESDKALEELTKFIQRYPASEFVSRANEAMQTISIARSQEAIRRLADEITPEPIIEIEEMPEIQEDDEPEEAEPVVAEPQTKTKKKGRK